MKIVKFGGLFYIYNMDISCGAKIVRVEISDNNNYANIWIDSQWAETKYSWYGFDNTGLEFTSPISLRLTREYNDRNQTIYKYMDIESNMTHCLDTIII